MPKGGPGERSLARLERLGPTVSHLSWRDIGLLLLQVEHRSRPSFKERNVLLVRLIYDGCLRVSEAVGVRPGDIIKSRTGWRVRVSGKGNRSREASISPSLTAELQAYAYRQGIARSQRLFPISRRRVHYIVSQAMKAARLERPEHVGAVHLLRHSGAIQRLLLTRNPRALQVQLGHRSPEMTLRYLKTLAIEESLEQMDRVDVWLQLEEMPRLAEGQDR